MLFTLDTGWKRPPLTLNQRGSWRVHSQTVKNVRQTAFIWGSSLHVRALFVTVHMFWIVPDMRRRDEDNIAATLKPFADGLVDAHIVPDDTPKFMDKPMPRIIQWPKHPMPGVRFVLET